MRVPVSWLREYTPVSERVEDLAERMTMQGLPVERILRPWEGLMGVRVGRVLEVTDHPRADRLCRTLVDDGGGQHEVVVGVRNMAPDDLVPYAPPGATLPGIEGKLERREIRGLASEGMLCSPKELAISGDHGGILILPSDLEPGADLKEALQLDEAVLDIEVLANRADLLSVVGVAREVAAMTGEELRFPRAEATGGPRRAEDEVTVDVTDGEKCPRYLALVIRGVSIGSSPLEVQVRLAAAGMRPRSNVVDATNYVMVEVGQPLHAFDLRRLAGPGIVVRRASAGERLATLDGVERSFTEDDLLIADRDHAVAVAGVIGGADSEVAGTTSDVLLESARFQPASVFRTSRRLGLRTDASVRFDRGVDPEGVEAAANRAAALIVGWSGGTRLEGAVDVGEIPPRRTVAVRPDRAGALLGVPVVSSEVREALGRLLIPATEEDGRVVAEIPGHRVDLEREVDLIEEIGRITGYHRVPSTLPGVRQAGGLDRLQRSRRRVRDLLAGAGMYEAMSYSFGPAGDAEVSALPRPPLRIANPISGEDGFLRASLVPGLLRAARRNVAHRRTSVRLFEVGNVFAAGEPQPEEEERVAAVLTGPAFEEWPADRREQDFLDGKGVVEHLLTGLGVSGWSLGGPPDGPWHPSRSATLLIDGSAAGELGELRPRIGRAFDLPGRVTAFELRLAPLVEAARAEPGYRELSRFPPLRRDVAFTLDAGIPAGEVRAVLHQAGGPLLDRVVLFDVFEGDPLPAGTRSLAFALDLRAPDRTLTDEEADAVVRAIADRLGADFGARLRSG